MACIRIVHLSNKSTSRKSLLESANFRFMRVSGLLIAKAIVRGSLREYAKKLSLHAGRHYLPSRKMAVATSIWGDHLKLQTFSQQRVIVPC